jgi:phosphate transport system protein
MVNSSASDHPKSIRSRFDRQIKGVQQDVMRMGALVENSCWLAHQALVDRDLEAAEAIAVQDKAIDRLYRQIELDCISVMALQAPVSQDLRLLSALMQLVRDLERIGDYAKDIGEISVKLFPYPVHPHMDRVGLMLDRCRAMVALSLEALANLDAQAGQAIKAKDDLVDSDYENLYQILVQAPANLGSVEPIVLLVLVIRHLERMADHATNIGNRVVYVVTGERI